MVIVCVEPTPIYGSVNFSFTKRKRKEKPPTKSRNENWEALGIFFPLLFG
jgi:hypothetical protein